MTQSTSETPRIRHDHASTPQVMTRHNGLVFYGLAAASFLETAIPVHATGLLQLFSADDEITRWIERCWWPAKCGHAREMRSYIETVWPEFDWGAAYADFYEAYRPLAAVLHARHGAREALVRSASAAQASAFYRCLGTSADDAGLRHMLYRMAADESAHFAFFRRTYVQRDRSGRLGVLKAYRTVVTCVARARDVDVQVAFSHLGARHWYGDTPFAHIEYPEFVQRMGELVRRHVPLGIAQRLLFRPWWKPRALQAVPTTARRPPARSRVLAGRQMQPSALQ
jgi:hypothetical protein